jgi:hypothetical protein
LRATINGGVRTFSEIASYNACVLAELDATGQLYVSARSLTGAEVTEVPDLVGAKLRGDIVRVPLRQVESLAQSYETAQISTCADEAPSDQPTPVLARTLAVAPTPTL